MERQIEPELMLDPAQALDFEQGPKDYGIQGFLYFFKNLVPDTVNKVVDLGCGPAEYLIPLAQEYPNLQIIGYDGSPAMIALAERRVAGTNIQVKCNMFTDIVDSADCVTSNSTLHHMHDPSVLWDTAKNIADQVLVIDFIRPETEEIAQQIVNTIAPNSGWFGKDYYLSLLAAFSEEELHKQIAGTDLQLFTVDVIPNLKAAVIHGKFKND